MLRMYVLYICRYTTMSFEKKSRLQLASWEGEELSELATVQSRQPAATYTSACWFFASLSGFNFPGGKVFFYWS